MADSVPIPEPPGLPLLGNLGEFSANPTNDIVRLANTYGMIYFECLLHLINCIDGLEQERFIGFTWALGRPSSSAPRRL